MLRAGLSRRSMNSPIVCRPPSRDSPMSCIRRSTSSKYALLAEKREWVAAYWPSTWPASRVRRSSSTGSASRLETRMAWANSASSSSALTRVALASRAAGRPSRAAIRYVSISSNCWTIRPRRWGESASATSSMREKPSAWMAKSV
ncbi:hypothetical protein SDC9_210992 [bioreactor metagenome]|uniref:Uncharacterized protein n=1 Tax=bioreactor metagenome TaxID=1076179 RepID=A0A645JHS0_9ZZZZ